MRPCTNIHVSCRNGLTALLKCFVNIPKTPDFVFLNRDRREVLLLEIGCVFDLYMEMAFNDKILKYQPILEILRDLGYQCKLIVFIFGSLGHVHNRVFSGLRLAGLSSRKSKQLAKFCSISAVIGSLAVWRRRCFLYPWTKTYLISEIFESCLL